VGRFLGLTDGPRLGTESCLGVNQNRGPGTVPLDRKRRIFRSPGLSLPRGGPHLPNRATALAVLGCVALLSAGVWLLGRPSEAPANAPETGVLVATAAAVLDGGTLRLGDRVVRLVGLTVPERGEYCSGTGSAAVDCGAAATNALAALVRDTRVECTWKGRDPVGRPLALCSARGVDLNLALVNAGWARASGEHPALLAAEQQARAARRGLWARG